MEAARRQTSAPGWATRRSTAASWRGFAQTNGLADLCEVPFCGEHACLLAVLGTKERTAAGMGDDMITELLTSLQLRDHARGDRNRAALPVLGMPDGKGGVHGIDIATSSSMGRSVFA